MTSDKIDKPRLGEAAEDATLHPRAVSAPRHVARPRTGAGPEDSDATPHENRRAEGTLDDLEATLAEANPSPWTVPPDPVALDEAAFERSLANAPDVLPAFESRDREHGISMDLPELEDGSYDPVAAFKALSMPPPARPAPSPIALDDGEIDALLDELLSPRIQEHAPPLLISEEVAAKFASGEHALSSTVVTRPVSTESDTSSPTDDERALSTVPGVAGSGTEELESRTFARPPAADEESASAAPDPHTAVPPQAAAPDHGARVALQTLRSRRLAHEDLPLVGASNVVRARRAKLLAAVAASETDLGGVERARAYVAAAELENEPDARLALLEHARAANPRDDVARTLSVGVHVLRNNHRAIADALLERMDAESRIHAAALLSEQLGEHEHALKVLLAEPKLFGRDDAARVALRAAARCQSVELVDRTRQAFGNGLSEALPSAAFDVARARIYATDEVSARGQASKPVDGFATDLLQAQNAISRGANGEASEALARAGTRVVRADGSRTELSSALFELGAELALLDNQFDRVTELGARAGSARGAELAWRTHMRLGTDGGDVATRWRNTATGLSHVRALHALAEDASRNGLVADAQTYLRDATVLEPGLSITRVLASFLTTVEDSSEGGPSPLRVAARARLSAADADETAALLRAQKSPQSIVCADVLLTDDALRVGLGDSKARAALGRELAQSDSSTRVGARVLAAWAAIESGDLPASDVLITPLVDEEPDIALAAALPYAERVNASPQALVSLFLRSSEGRSGERSAFLATEAARLSIAANLSPEDAMRRAEAAASYLPVMAIAETLARLQGRFSDLAVLHRSIAEESHSPFVRASHWVRYAMASDGEEAQAALHRAADNVPWDIATLDLRSRFVSGGPGIIESQERADAIAATLPHRVKEALVAGEVRVALATLFADALDGKLALPAHELASRCSELLLFRTGSFAQLAKRLADHVPVSDAPQHALRTIVERAFLEQAILRNSLAATTLFSSALEVAPTDVLALRAAFRGAVESGDGVRAGHLSERLAAILSANDAAAYLRYAVRKRADARVDAQEDVEGVATSADALLMRNSRRADAWLALRTEAAAREAGDPQSVAFAILRQSGQLGARERSALATRASQTLRDTGLLAEAHAVLNESIVAVPDSTFALEAAAVVADDLNDHAAAAELYERAASIARGPARRAALWHRAGVLWQDALANDERALTALQFAADANPAWLDVFGRLEGLLRERGDFQGLRKRAEQRIAMGGSAPELIEFNMRVARLHVDARDYPAASLAARRALTLDARNLIALRLWADTSELVSDWNATTEALVRLARLTTDVDELHSAFLRLARIYDVHVPDHSRSEAAYRRAAKLMPEDRRTLEALGRFLARERPTGEHTEHLTEARGLFEKIVEAESDPRKKQSFRVELAAICERLGDTGAAERVLESARRAAPHDMTILRATAALLKRIEARDPKGQGGPSSARIALQVHASRTIAAFRQRIVRSPHDLDGWHGLAEAMSWRGADNIYMRAAASSALALGVLDATLGESFGVPEDMEARTLGGALSELDVLLLPEQSSPSILTLFRALREPLAKAFPLEPKTLGATKIGKSDKALLEEAQRAFGRSMEVWTTERPGICAVSEDVLVISQELVTTADRREITFLFARAARLDADGASFVTRLPADRTRAFLDALVHRLTGLPDESLPPRLAEMDRKLERVLPRARVDEFSALTREIVRDLESGLAIVACMAVAARYALLRTGSVVASTNALLRLERRSRADTFMDPAARIAYLGEVPQALDLVFFGFSDAYLRMLDIIVGPPRSPYSLVPPPTATPSKPS